MSNNEDIVGSLEYTHMKNADHRSSAEHYKDTVFISVKHKIKNADHRSSAGHYKDKVFISVKHKIKKDDHRSSVEH